MSLKAMSEYVRYSKYAIYNKEKSRRETWEEQIDRMFEMHQKKFGGLIDLFKEDFEFAKKMVKEKKILGSQRALQFGGKAILDREAKIYNCTASYADRVSFFKEAMYLLLCGCGVGFSVQKHHVEKLPNLVKRSKGKKTFVVPDSIEGWSDAVGVLMQSFFEDKDKFYIYDLECSIDSVSGYEIEFDYSVIRPAGSPLSWGGVAPGSSGLERSIKFVERVLNEAVQKGQKLRPIDVYDIIMHASDAVLTGGVRRSATICLFSHDDEEMLKAKTGDWFITNPQRGRSNNSALLIRNEITEKEFKNIMTSVKEFGEPGFVFADNKEFLTNPCVEIGLYAYDDNMVSGWQMCNLCEINMKKCKTPDDFYNACRAAAILGTMQAAYTKMKYLGGVTESILKRESLLGVSMTGMMEDPEISFNPEIQKAGAKIVLDFNKKISGFLGINECARATCVKPAGTTSILLETSSGIHPHHASRYFRRIQANRLEFPAKVFQEKNPLAVEESVWSSNNTDLILTFVCEIEKGAKTKNNVSAIQLLEYVKLTQKNWVEYGTRKERCAQPWLKHNVSNTINVLDNEWEDVEKFIYKNKKSFTGVSLLPNQGDKDYPQAPFTTVYTPKEIVEHYGDGSLMASGLIVDGLHVFKNNLWAACDFVLGIGEKLVETEKPEMPFSLSSFSEEMMKYYEDNEMYNSNLLKKDWKRRAIQFADRYFNGNLRKMTYCLKDVHNWKLWCDLKREYVDLDWSVVFEKEYKIDVGSIGGDACAGGKCDIGDLGNNIESKKRNS
jgi:ribonucleoside-diphosphate reductase alpha chain